VLIRGAGVDLDRFVPAPPRKGPVIIVLASRMLWDKGVREFVDAARLLRARGVAARCVLVGTPDAGNPSAVAEAQLNDWQERGDVEWWGHRDDMPRVLAQAHVVCLPSYREGLPTILIEAAAAGLPLVATDVPGCREVVHPGVNGLLVPARDAASLAAAMATLAADETLRLRYGRQSRRLAEAEFGIGRVSLATLDLYASLIDHRPGRSGAEGS
jgi:glycosyltransferase involved in cell wall biosynthesis